MSYNTNKLIGFIYNSSISDTSLFINNLMDKLEYKKDNSWCSSLDQLSAFEDKFSKTSLVVIAGGDGSIDYGRWENDKEFVDFNNLQFRHVFYYEHVNQSEYTQYLWPLLGSIGSPSWMRVRATLNQYTIDKINKINLLERFFKIVEMKIFKSPVNTCYTDNNSHNGFRISY